MDPAPLPDKKYSDFEINMFVRSFNEASLQEKK